MGFEMHHIAIGRFALGHLRARPFSRDEGHAFEPMRDAKDLLPEERPFGYHNPENGRARLAMLTRMMGSVLPPRTTAGSLGRT